MDTNILFQDSIKEQKSRKKLCKMEDGPACILVNNIKNYKNDEEIENNNITYKKFK